MEPWTMNRAPLDTIVALAEAKRLARIYYQKLTETKPTCRVIEPYRLLEHSGALMVMAWQVDPCCDGEAWRTFRCDRIKEVTDGGGEFNPRRDVDIASGQLDSFMAVCGRQKAKGKPEDAYRDYLLAAVRDHLLTEDERTRAENLAQRVPTKKMKVVHAQVFADLLFDALLDHEISDDEEAFLDDVRGFMETIGWAP